MRSSKAAQLVNDQTVQRKRSGAAASVTITFQKKTEIQTNMEDAESETEVRPPAHETNGIAKCTCILRFWPGRKHYAPWVCQPSNEPIGGASDNPLLGSPLTATK